MTSLSISIVTYKTNQAELSETLGHLINSCDEAIRCNTLHNYSIDLIDNGPEPTNKNTLNQIVKNFTKQINIISGHGNIGYGRANNLSIFKSNSDFHLILNPDITLTREAIHEGITDLQRDGSIVAVACSTRSPCGNIQYTAKRYPSLLVLAVRLIDCKVLNNLFKKQLNAYTYKNSAIEDHLNIEMASGSFMLCRLPALKEIHGFDERFFMYFEDFDLSIRLKPLGKIVQSPRVIATHSGGNTGRKGLKHIYYFSKSAFIFFNKHHWKLI